MTILQKPAELNLSGNLPKFVLSSSEGVDFILKKGSEVLLSAHYVPGKDSQITIDVKDIVESSLSCILKDQEQPYIQPDLSATFTAEVGGQTIDFKVVKGGVDRLATSASNFLKTNFLTWQPQTKHVTYYMPEFLTFFAVVDCSVKVKAYFFDGGVKTEEVKELYMAAAGSAHTVPVQYAIIAGKFGSKMPSFYDVWVEGTNGERFSYIQRYVAGSMMSEQEDWILFENSLGGIDTFRAYGQTELTAEHTHNLAEMGEEVEEYRVDTTRSYQKSTGWLNDRQRRWLLDFFPAKQKYLYTRNFLRRIIVSEDNTSFVDKELPTGYSFTYRYADAKPLLNLARVEELPADLHIDVPELGSFTIPPRLVEFPSQNLSEGVLFPVQNPHSENWATTTIGAILQYVTDNIITMGGDGTGGVGHTHNNFSLLQGLQFIKEYLTVNGQKIKAGYADKAGEIVGDKYLRKDKEDQTNFLIKFGEFIDSMIAGKGTGIFPNGRIQTDRLEVRGSMLVKELIFNRWFAQEGNVTYSEAGTIERVEQLPDGTYDLYLRKRWDTDITAFAENDIAYGSINDLFNSGKYYDSWFRILAVQPAHNKLTVILYPDAEVPGGKNNIPEPSMVITRRGNPVNEDRQGFWYISSYEGCICMLDGVTKPILEENNYSIIIGKLKHLSIFDNLPINYRQSYVYCRGIATQDLMRVDYKGVVHRTENHRGFWSLVVAQSDEPYRSTNTAFDVVSHIGCEFMCLVDGTKEEPKFACTDWAMIRGNPEFTIDIESTNGWDFDFGYDIRQRDDGTWLPFTTFKVTGKLYNQDVTDKILDSDVTWTRDTGNPAEDNAWAVRHADCGKTLELTGEDLGKDYRDRTIFKFRAEALLRDGNQMRTAARVKTFREQ